MKMWFDVGKTYVLFTMIDFFLISSCSCSHFSFSFHLCCDHGGSKCGFLVPGLLPGPPEASEGSPVLVPALVPPEASGGPPFWCRHLNPFWCPAPINRIFCRRGCYHLTPRNTGWTRVPKRVVRTPYVWCVVVCARLKIVSCVFVSSRAAKKAFVAPRANIFGSFVMRILWYEFPILADNFRESGIFGISRGHRVSRTRQN